MNFEEYQYHPRYIRSEYLTYEALERRRKRRALFGLALLLLCAAGLVALLK